MIHVKNFLQRLFGDPDEDREVQAQEIQELRERRRDSDRAAREAISKAEPTGVLLRDLITGAYDPHSAPYMRGAAR